MSVNAFQNFSNGETDFPAGAAEPIPNNISLLPIIAVNAATTLTPAQSGSIIAVSTAAGGAYTITLPPPALAGLNYKFVIANKTAANNVAITSATAATLQGVVLGAATAAAATNNVTATLTQANLHIGDWCDIVSDGTNYHIRGEGQTAAYIAIT